MASKQWRWLPVSTHSRLKAAGPTAAGRSRARCRFNTQPPEGGWRGLPSRKGWSQGFNTQPPEGGWPNSNQSDYPRYRFNTQPPEGGWTGSKACQTRPQGVSTHSRLKAAGEFEAEIIGKRLFQHTAA